MEIKEHHDKMKENIKKLQNTNLLDKSSVKDIHLFFFLCYKSKIRNV